MLDLSREEILDRFKKSLAEGNILLGVGAGTGITAKSAEAGGADIFVIYNSGRFRMAGRGSLAGLLSYGDANQIVVEMGAEVLPVVKDTPVLAGVCGTDPFRVMPKFLQQLKDQGFNGVQNFPTVGLIDGVFRKNLEETGMGYGLEVDMIAEAHKLDMLTCPYVFDEEQAAAMTRAGADIIVAHMGLTTGGTIGAETARTLDDCVEIDLRHRQGGQGNQPGCAGHLPRRSHLRAQGRCLHHRARARGGRLLRRDLHRASCGRARHQGPDRGVQVHQEIALREGRLLLRRKAAPSCLTMAAIARSGATASTSHMGGCDFTHERQ